MEMTYPKFYRKAGTCVKQINELQARVIILPPESTVPERMTSTFPTKYRLAEYLEGFNEVDESEYKQFGMSFYIALENEIRHFREKQNIGK
jgi:hypothetical protein